MKFKKIGALIMTAAMTTGLMAGCGSADAPADGSSAQAATKTEAKADTAASGETEKVTLKIWVPEEEVDITDQMVQKFDEAHTEFDITYEIAVVGIDEAPQALETDADTAADIFYTPSGGVGDLAGKGLLLPIAKDIDELSKSLSSVRDRIEMHETAVERSEEEYREIIKVLSDG